MKGLRIHFLSGLVDFIDEFIGIYSGSYLSGNQGPLDRELSPEFSPVVPL
jgi:hypothetical protein